MNIYLRIPFSLYKIFSNHSVLLRSNQIWKIYSENSSEPQYLNVFKAFKNNIKVFNNSTDNFINRTLQFRNYKKIKISDIRRFKGSWLKKEGFLTDNNLPEIESNQVKLLPNGTVRILSRVLSKFFDWVGHETT